VGRSATSEDNIAWAREAFAAMEPFTANQLRYMNYLDEDDMQHDPARAAYGPNYDRLVQVKSRYDPENLFHMNTNITPTTR
jgi:FAD/FMN-containing dehydrogenase